MGSNKVRPWIRYWARIFDLLLYGILCTLFLGTIPFPFSVDQLTSHYSIGTALLMMFTLVSVLNLIICITIEAVLLYAWGTTPGKWYLRIKIAEAPLNWGPAFKRTFLVWLKGMAFCIPPFTIITLIWSYFRLKKYKTTAWDQELNLTVTHEKIGILRGLSVMILIMTLPIASSILTHKLGHKNMVIEYYELVSRFFNSNSTVQAPEGPLVWKPFYSKNGSFSVEFPKVGTIECKTLTHESLCTHVHHELNGPVMYQVFVTETPPNHKDPKEYLDFLFTAFDERFKKQGLKLVERQPGQDKNGNPLLTFKYVDSGGAIMNGIITSYPEKKLNVMLSTGRKQNNQAPQEDQHFIESFSFTQ